MQFDTTKVIQNKNITDFEFKLLQKKPSESPRFQSWDERRRCSTLPFGMVRATNLLYMSSAHPTGSGFVPVDVMVWGSSGEPISPTG
jgi:hypothetical protein